MEKISYRHNVMGINSIQTFLSIKGGFNNNVRDVYLVRAVGEPQNINDIIKETDKQMDIEMSNRRLVYKRFSSLPQIIAMSDSEFYSALYSDFNDGKTGGFKNIKSGSNLDRVITEAFNTIINIYKDTKNNISPSMIRNFGTKILFWLDQTMGDSLEGWTEKASIKVIADNVVKEQEYLFYLFLTYVGCDVLLIENRSDISVDDKIMQYSHKLELGNFGTSLINKYEKYVPVKKPESVRNTANSGRENIKVVIPQRKYISGDDRDKSFEELAQLASSVVLIAIHNGDGEVVGTGSGIMIGRNGYILTNNHVASGGHFYSVRIEDDEEVYATKEVIKYNSATDLAVIRIKRQLNPIPIYQGEKKLVRGQQVVAIGSPLGLFNSVSDGIISGFRNINDVDMIQFTAPISHGSSGGAVLNMKGELIGISTAGFDDGQNINLAIGYENIKLFTNGFTSIISV